MADRSAGTDAAGSQGGHGRTLLVLFGGVLLGALDIAIVGPALPAIGAAYALDAAALSWIFGIYILVSLISAPLLAAWSDRSGRRSVYAFCLVTFGAGSVIVAAAPSFDLLLLGRAIQAAGAGGMLPVASAVIADTFPEHRRGSALGLIGAVFGLAFVLGPVLGGLLLQWSWRFLFLINVPLLALLVPAALRALPSHRASKPQAVDWRGALLLAVALGSTALALTRAEMLQAVDGHGFLWPAGLLVAGLAAMFLFYRVEAAAQAPLLSPRLLRAPRMQAVSMLAVATGFVEATMVFMPTLAVAAFDVSARIASFMLLPLVAALILGSVVAGRVLDRIGPAPVIRAGMGMVVLGLALLALLPPGVTAFYGGGLAVGFGLASLLGAPLRFVAQQEGGVAERGASQGMLTMFLGAGRLAGAALIGGIVPRGSIDAGGLRVALLVVACLCATSLLATRRLRSA